MSNVLAFLSQPERTYGSLTPQLETVIIEGSSVRLLRLRANPLAIAQGHTFACHQLIGSTDFTVPKLAILTCSSGVLS